MSGVSTSSERPEWTPQFLRTARTAATRGITDRTTDAADKIALAVRELAAAVRALRPQLAGAGAEPAHHGALGDIDASIDHAGRRGR